MNIQRTLDAFEKLTRMGDVTLYEPAGDTPQVEHTSAARYQSASLAECITNVQTPKGAKPVLKTMVTTACEKNCFYCPFRAGRGKTERHTFKPDELAGAFDQLQRAKLTDGIFLSSGIIKGGVAAQDKILDTIDIIRKRYRYGGYVHLKLMPGAEYDQVARAVQLADRISINLEGPTPERLNALAPKKDFNTELVERLKWAHELSELRRREGLKAPSIVTQFVVGAVGDTDLELLATTERLHRQMGLARAYYSAFHPITHTPFENLKATAPLREHRLYQASFLLRDYRWDVEDLLFEDGGNLNLHTDPKRAWAETHLRHRPVDLMHANREELMRVPGIGPKGADAILTARLTHTLRELAHLRALGIAAPEKAAPYVLFDGKAPPTQLSLL